MDHKIVLPHGVKHILRRLHGKGFEAYVVGGCVRDSLLNLSPHDWDICTNALPEQVIESFSDTAVLRTGLKHGTVTVLLEKQPYEITTFRTDGAYTDHRHTDRVEFVSSLEEDLKRRDFTVNAMAFSEESGIVDLFGGREDLRAGLIRCVGNPDARFTEDALRVMRALRFASTYNFSIEAETASSLLRNTPALASIAVERIREELTRLLCGSGVLHILLDYKDVFSFIIPELAPCIGFQQNNPYHCFDVYEHIAHAVADYAGNDPVVKIALLLHDIGKPFCYTEDERGGHFRGHGVVSREIAEGVFQRLKYDNQTKHDALELIQIHDATIEPTSRVVRRWLNKIGYEQFCRLLKVRMADIHAHAPATQASRVERCEALERIAEEVREEGMCFSLKDMAVNGRDIIALGAKPGKQIGVILNALLEKILSDTLPNEKNALLAEAKSFL